MIAWLSNVLVFMEWVRKFLQTSAQHAQTGWARFWLSVPFPAARNICENNYTS